MIFTIVSRMWLHENHVVQRRRQSWVGRRAVGEGNTLQSTQCLRILLTSIHKSALYMGLTESVGMTLRPDFAYHILKR